MTTRVPYSMTDSPINVRAYGAKGDGTTDDRAAFNLALAAAAGKTLYVPAGTYRVGAGLTVSNRTRIVGDGPTASLINYRPTVTTDNQLFDFDNVDNVHLEGLGLALETGGGDGLVDLAHRAGADAAKLLALHAGELSQRYQPLGGFVDGSPGGAVSGSHNHDWVVGESARASAGWGARGARVRSLDPVGAEHVADRILGQRLAD